MNGAHGASVRDAPRGAFLPPLRSTGAELGICGADRSGGGVWGGAGGGMGGAGRMFLGPHAPRLDEKGRLFLPAKYRDELSGGVVITKGQERCLYVFPADEFGRITESLRTAPVTAKSVRDYSRVFFAS